MAYMHMPCYFFFFCRGVHIFLNDDDASSFPAGVLPTFCSKRCAAGVNVFPLAFPRLSPKSNAGLLGNFGTGFLASWAVFSARLVRAIRSTMRWWRSSRRRMFPMWKGLGSDDEPKTTLRFSGPASDSSSSSSSLPTNEYPFTRGVSPPPLVDIISELPSRGRPAIASSMADIEGDGGGILCCCCCCSSVS